MFGEKKKAQELFKNEKNEYEKISYEYFLPKLLNNGFKITNPDIYLLSEEAIKTIAELNADSKNLKNIDVFLRMIVKQEAVKSSSIEGTRTTFSEILLPEQNFKDIEKTKDRTITINVYNTKILNGYTVYVEKHAMDTDEDEGAYGQVLPGAKFRITVHQENSGVEYTTWTDTTNEEGMINGLTFNGFGYITITLEELVAPDG